MTDELKIVNVADLKEGDLFSFKTIKRPVFFRFVKLENGIITYEEIKSHYQFTTSHTWQNVLKKEIQ
jgi:hypothetical protein